MRISSRGSSIHVPSFLWTLVRTDFKVRYHGSAGGFVWALLRPLTLYAVLLIVFSYVFPSDPQYRLNLIIGLFLWDFFVEASKSGLGSLLAKGHLLTKIRLPTWLLVIGSASNALITLAFFVLLILLSLIASNHAPSLLQLALFIVYLLLFVAILVGFALTTSVLFLRYRDLNQVWDLIIQVGFFLAPIVYPISVLPERLHFYLYLWPPTPVIQFSRSVLIDHVVPTPLAHLLLVAEAACALVIGTLVFRQYSRRVLEYL